MKVDKCNKDKNQQKRHKVEKCQKKVNKTVIERQRLQNESKYAAAQKIQLSQIIREIIALVI